MHGPLALRAHVLDQAADARAEELLPEPVHEHPGRERILRRQSASAPGQAGSAGATRGSGGLRQEPRNGGFDHGAALVLPVAARQDASHKRRHGLRHHRVRLCRPCTPAAWQSDLTLPQVDRVMARAEDDKARSSSPACWRVRCPGWRPVPCALRRPARSGRRVEPERRDRKPDAARAVGVERRFRARRPPPARGLSRHQIAGLLLVVAAISRSASRPRMPTISWPLK